jgi:enamine deaminase RidA (YjgF/YER057c/UK114 family)
MKQRQLVSSGGRYESQVGYSRAVRVGDAVFVAGTVGAGRTAYDQTKAAIAVIERALKEVGSSLDDVVRTRLFVVNIDDWEEIGCAHAESFREIRPACSMVEVRRLIAPEYLVEVEADACIR